MHLILVAILAAVAVKVIAADSTDYNNVNNDGSFAFGLSNDDIGGHYHTASGHPKIAVNGRFGSRNAATGQVEETVYTAGPRGFRPQGPQIHRRHDFSQVPRPVGTPEDPLADPFEDPTYNFDVKAGEYQKVEGADSTGRVRGEYTYFDDIGERHDVKYDTVQGFEVTNAVPDAPSNVGFGLPLFKADKSARGKIAFEKGPGGQYKFISSGPDQRRSEQIGADGITRGSYSYLDDKGLQRTVEYIAGPGIGYRVTSSRTGAGTHLLPPTALPTFSPSYSPSFTPSFTKPISPTASPPSSPTPISNTDYFPSGELSAFYDPAYTDIEGLKPPNIYNPYEGSYQNYGILSSTASTWSPAFDLTPPFENSYSPTTSTFSSPPPSSSASNSQSSVPFSPNASPTDGVAASVVPVSGDWRPGMVINIDLLQPGRSPSPGDAMRQETAAKLQVEKVTKCMRKPNNEFSCTVTKSEVGRKPTRRRISKAARDEEEEK